MKVKQIFRINRERWGRTPEIKRPEGGAEAANIKVKEYEND